MITASARDAAKNLQSTRRRFNGGYGRYDILKAPTAAQQHRQDCEHVVNIETAHKPRDHLRFTEARTETKTRR